jgi:CheY-like chemotaxis protein
LRLSAEEIQKAGARGVLLTRQLLAFSRKNVTTPEILDLAEVVRDMESMLHRLIGEEVQLLTRTGGYPLRVRADRGQMEQVLANLAVNSRDAMPSGGGLVIEVSATEITGQEPESGLNLSAGPYVALTVSDEGSGMSPEVIGHLFEPFFTTKEQGKGTGLGLSVVYGIVRQSGGDIQVESSSGNGATFRILLPRVGEPEPAAPSDGTGPPAQKSEGRAVILLVEDEDAVRALARDFLGIFGYEVIEANSGEEALALFDRHRASVRAVVSDIVMPGIGGVDLARRLVALKPGLKVLLVSGYARDSLNDSNFGGEGFAFLQKPYTLEDFGRRIAELLSAPSAAPR